MNFNKADFGVRPLCAALLVGTILGGGAMPALAQEASGPAPAAAAEPAQRLPEIPAAVAAQPSGTIRTIAVTGNQRLEADTVLSYTSLRPNEPYTRERLDDALRDLYATELFADVQIRDDAGTLTIEVRENPVVNRIVLEGNKRLKDEKIGPEIKLGPRQIFTRSKVRADVARIIELYRRQGRFAAEVEPRMVQLDQNRVDIVYEIQEGPRSKVRQINIIGNEKFSDDDLRSEMATKQARLLSFLSSNDTYDPDRLAFDQQKLRQFYLINGYADFRVISAVAELTPDKRDFIITYVVEEGQRYKFGDVKIDSNIRDLSTDLLTPVLPMKTGDWYDAKKVEDTVASLNENAGVFGYAFVDVRPQFDRNRETLTMGITFQIADAPRVYVERVEINGNTNTRDKVIRREFRVAEGDPFNSVAVRRSRDRIQSLGFFQDNLEITQTQGSAPDRVVLGVDVEEKATGELQVSAGFSSIEQFLVNLSIRQRNFMGKGQELRAAVNYSSYSKSVELGFTEPYVFDRNVALGFDVYRRDYNSFNFINNDRNTTYEQVTTGFQVRAGVPITEYLSAALRYGLNYDEVSLDERIFFNDPDGAGPLPAVCDPLLAGRYLCDAIGNRLTSSIGYSLVYDTLDSRVRPTRGLRAILSQDFAGLGGDVRYLRTKFNGSRYWNVGSGFIFSANLEGGYILGLEEDRVDSQGNEIDKVRLIDRFFLGEPQIRGFDIRGVGPRIRRRGFQTDENGYVLDANGNFIPSDEEGRYTEDALGGHAYYLARAELEIPLGSTGRELGIRPSIFVDVGGLFDLIDPVTQTVLPTDPRAQNRCINPADGTSVPLPGSGNCPSNFTLAGGITPFQEVYLGDTAKPRVSIGIGVNWNSPFGPFRIDVAQALVKADGDNTKLLTFNVGTAF